MSHLGIKAHHDHAWLEIGDLATLLNAKARLQLLQDSGVPALRADATYIRLKPGVGALVGLDILLEPQDGEISLSGYVRTHTPARAAELARKWHADRAVATPAGAGVRLLAGGQSVLFLFPNDARIEGMRFVSDVEKLKRLLGQIETIREDGWRVRGRKTILETVRYKPERRLILRAHLAQKNDRTGAKRERDVFIRFFADNRGEKIARFRRALETQPIGRSLPGLLGVAHGGRLFVEEAVAGGELLPHVLDGTADAAAIAAMLTNLHRSRVDGLPEITCDQILATARESADNLLRVEPAFATLLTPILHRLASLLPATGKSASGRMATLHGDCHLHQFLNGPNGPVLVDFERMTRGHPLFDLGHLCAHLSILEGREPDAAPAIHSFVATLSTSYASRNPDVDMADLQFFLGCGLIERALLPFRRIQEDWPQRCAELLSLTRDSIRAGSNRREPALHGETQETLEPWTVVHPRSGPTWPASSFDGGKLCFGTYETRARRFVPVDPTADRELPGLAAWATRGELISYRCGRRATLRVDGDRFVKIVRPSRASDLERRLSGLERLATRSRERLPAFARPLESDIENGVFVFAELAGDSMHDRLLRGTEDFQCVARGLVAFHSIAVHDTDHLPPAHEHAPLRTWSDYVGKIDRGLFAECEIARRHLESDDHALTGPSDRLVHGDLHDKNLLAAGDNLGILDLDQLGVGNPARDLGNLCAHFVLRALQTGDSPAHGRADARRFLDAYANHGGSIHTPSIAAIGAHTLFRLACLYRFRKRWRPICPDLLGEIPNWTGGHL